MRASRLLNMRVESIDGQRFFGLIKDIRVRNNQIVHIIISRGGIFSKAIYFEPEAGIVADVDSMNLQDGREVTRASGKEMRRVLEGTHSLYDLKVYDVDHLLIGTLADATITPDFKILEYEVSRSFFDDVDRGFALIPVEELTYDGTAMRFCRHYNEIPENGREGGIIRKTLGDEGDDQ